MKKVYFIAIMLSAAIVLTTGVVQAAEQEEQDNEFLLNLEEFNNKVLSKYILRLGDLDQDRVIQECMALARENIINNKEAFFEKAKELLDKKPAGQADMSQWTPIDPNWQSLADTAVESMRKGFEGGASRTTNYGMGLYRAWNPIQVAHTSRMMVFSHIDKGNLFGKRITLESMASPKMYVIKNDPHDPIIGIETPIDLFIISLHHNYDGIYVPAKVECFDSKNLAAMKEEVEKIKKAEDLKYEQEKTRAKRAAAAKAKRNLERQKQAISAKAAQDKAKELEAEAKEMTTGQDLIIQEAVKAEEAKKE